MYGQMESQEQTTMKSETKYKIFIHQNAVCKMSAIL